jgi:hypothetical protein
MIKYQVTKTFTDGILKGITIIESTNIEFEIGTEVKNPIGGSPYKIIDVKPC